MSNLEVIVTADGSHTLFDPAVAETYHSSHGALAESRHVFIDNGFRFVREQGNKTAISILEVGFGTGLNVLLTALEARRYAISVEFVSVESRPLKREIVERLNYPDVVGDEAGGPLFRRLHELSWESRHAVTDCFLLEKQNKRIQDADFASNSFDLIYFDAFAARHQPEMWDISLFRKLAASLRDGGVLVTYSARGQLKRDLRSCGLEVQTLAGAPGKKEMVRAIRS